MTTTEEFTIGADASASDVHECFDCHGIVIFKDLLSKDLLNSHRSAVNRLLRLRLVSLDMPASDDIDENLNELVRIDRRYAMDIIRAAKDSPFFYAVLADPKLHAISRACLDCETLLAVHDLAQFRIDPPDDDLRNFDWHQDFPYNVTSLNAVTFWFPLRSVDEDMGPLVVVPGSHRSVAPVTMDASRHQPGTGTAHTTFRFDIDKREAEKNAVPVYPVLEGDVVVFHSLLIHRSSVNRSKRSRWTFNPRFCDAADPSFSGRGWIAVRDKTPSVFAQLFPEYVREAGGHDAP